MLSFGVLCGAKRAWGRVATVSIGRAPRTPLNIADQNKQESLTIWVLLELWLKRVFRAPLFDSIRKLEIAGIMELIDQHKLDVQLKRF